MSISVGSPIEIFTGGWFSSGTDSQVENYCCLSSSPTYSTPVLSPFSVFTGGWFSGWNHSFPSFLDYPSFFSCNESIGEESSACSSFLNFSVVPDFYCK